MQEGYVKIHRKLLDNPIFLKSELLQLFIYCIVKANHKDNSVIFNNENITVKRGSFITGRVQLSKDLKQSQSSCYRRLKILSNLGYISLKSNNKFTLVIVEKYNTYQNENLKSNNKRTTTEQQLNTNKNDKECKEVIKHNIPLTKKQKEKYYLNFAVNLFLSITNKKNEYSYGYSIINKLLKLKSQDNITYLQKILMVMYIIRKNAHYVNEQKYIGILTNQYRQLSYSDFHKIFDNQTLITLKYPDEYN